jgi:uncharacterized protein (DUF58 family)
MIVPRNRLLIWVTMLVLPFAALAGLSPASALLSLAIIGLFLAVAILDAVLGFGALDGIKVALPKVVRLSKDRAGVLELQITNEQQKQKQLRFGLPLPRELTSPQEDLTAILPAQNALSRLTWPCTPLRRGNYILDKCHLEGSSPLGFWSIRGTTPMQGEVRVYPNLLTERKAVAALFLNRGNFGTRAQRQVGKGRDFEKLRDYVPGDSYDEVHWKATAKRGKPVTKIFQIERTQEVYVIIDASRLSARAVEIPDAAEGEAKTTSVLERYITAALILGLAAEHQGDLFGLLTFSDKVQKFVRAKNGKAHYTACRDALYTLHPQVVTPDFGELFTFIRLRLRRRALLIFLTALDDPVLAENFTRHLDLVSRQHLILVNMMQPPGAQPAFSNTNINSVDEIYQQLGSHVLWNNLRELGKILQRRGASFSLVENEKLSAQLVTQYLNVKRRQQL